MSKKITFSSLTEAVRFTTAKGIPVEGFVGHRANTPVGVITLCADVLFVNGKETSVVAYEKLLDSFAESLSEQA